MSVLRQAFFEMLELLVPDNCCHCGARSEREGYGLCARCSGSIPTLSPRRCRGCDLSEPSGSVPVLLGSDGMCSACSDEVERPRIHAFAPFSGVVLPSLLLGLKYRGQRHLARPLAHLMWLAARDRLALNAFDAVVPVPLHDRRLLRRGFNQVALLSMGICQRGNLPLFHALKRPSPTRPQARLGSADRALNPRGAFALSAAFSDSIEGRRILLLDDVVTTGATVTECARVLRSRGAARVDVMCLGRTLRTR